MLNLMLVFADGMVLLRVARYMLGVLHVVVLAVWVVSVRSSGRREAI